MSRQTDVSEATSICCELNGIFRSFGKDGVVCYLRGIYHACVQDLGGGAFNVVMNSQVPQMLGITQKNLFAATQIKQ